MPMQSNPFCEPAARKPLGKELCQHIHYEALVRAAQGEFAADVPPTLDLVELRHRASLLGREIYLQHPETIAVLFAGISLSVYRTVRILYCSRLERSIAMVWHILQAMAKEVHADVPLYEAVWAICMYQKEQRKHETTVTVEHLPTSWWVMHVIYEDDGKHDESHTSRYNVLVCVCDLVCQAILAFRLTNQHQVSETYGEVIYEALSHCRHPRPEAAAGLVWSFPQHIFVEHTLSPDCHTGCTRLGISLEIGRERPEFFQTLLVNWHRESTRRSVHVERWVAVFDSYLYRATGSSPWHSRKEDDHEYRHRLGYTRDPAWQCPALRYFLPLHPASITQDGAIGYEGKHYAHDLLTYWPGASVMIRQSEQREACLWVYLNGSILCQAGAREFQWDDGGAWSHRRGGKL